MRITQSLTEFQQKCEEELCSALATKGKKLADRILAGESETYIRASIYDTDIVIYIYEDEAQFHRAGKVTGRFEYQDFSNANELKKAFISAVEIQVAVTET